MADQDQWERSLPAHVTTPLLTRITEQSMDEDYQHVAWRKQGAGPGPSAPDRPRLVAALVVAGFGILVTTAAVQTSANSDVADASRETLIQRINTERDQVEVQEQTIADLQDQTIDLQEALDALTEEQASATARLRRLEVATGYVAVRGEGVRVTVDDPPDPTDTTELVRDEDLAWLVNGLWEAGAEAIAINDQRLNALGAIRNVGIAVKVNSMPVNPPYVVQAIGDNDTLQADLLDTTHGQRFFNLADQLGFGVDMQNDDELQLPAARGPNLLHARRGTSGKPDMNNEEANP
jgi:uncharacterized protein YlxW (UPF0749 family)